jgi:hypothetical protein
MSKPRRIETVAYLKDGQVHIIHRELFFEKLRTKYKEFKRFNIIAEDIFKKRSNDQNRYYWGVIIDLFLRGYEEMNGERMHFEIVNKETGEILRLPLSIKEEQDKAHETLKAVYEVKSTKELSTTDCEEYYSYCREYIKFCYNIDVPLPNSEYKMFLK